MHKIEMVCYSFAGYELGAVRKEEMGVCVKNLLRVSQNAIKTNYKKPLSRECRLPVGI